MRIIAGKGRSLPLKTIEGIDTRPTTDRIKETLFNMLQYEIADCRFLDLFAGSGQIGLEAVSRGAKEAVFVESGKKQQHVYRIILTLPNLMTSAVYCRWTSWQLSGVWKEKGHSRLFSWIRLTIRSWKRMC